MGDAATKAWMSHEACLALERSTDQRYEWFDGHIYAMAGGTVAHAALAGAIIGELRALSLGCDCLVLSSDAKLRVLATGLATYPDGSVVCGPLSTDPSDANVITNPTLVFEVLSDSTEGYDRGKKFENYQQIPSLRDYVLVSQYAKRIEVFSREGEGQWTLRVAGAGQSVPLTAMAGVIEVDRVYAGIPLTSESRGGAATG
ncbi:MAG: Uma2 family endonuclease [Deltaproteobacteria bacterium]|nr:Uma2 family endonuclease [Myxococcales bacterium]MDP3220625.1 Uma2 family endonuclease [Deltaproteobacteria bacterium]